MIETSRVHTGAADKHQGAKAPSGKGSNGKQNGKGAVTHKGLKVSLSTDNAHRASAFARCSLDMANFQG